MRYEWKHPCLRSSCRKDLQRNPFLIECRSIEWQICPWPNCVIVRHSKTTYYSYVKLYVGIRRTKPKVSPSFVCCSSYHTLLTRVTILRVHELLIDIIIHKIIALVVIFGRQHDSPSSLSTSVLLLNLRLSRLSS